MLIFFAIAVAVYACAVWWKYEHELNQLPEIRSKRNIIINAQFLNLLLIVLITLLIIIHFLYGEPFNHTLLLFCILVRDIRAVACAQVSLKKLIESRAEETCKHETDKIALIQILKRFGIEHESCVHGVKTVYGKPARLIMLYTFDNDDNFISRELIE